MCKNLLVSNFSRKPQKLTLVMSLNPISAGHKTYYVFMLTFFKKILCLCLFLLYFIIVRGVCFLLFCRYLFHFSLKSVPKKTVFISTLAHFHEITLSQRRIHRRTFVCAI